MYKIAVKLNYAFSENNFIFKFIDITVKTKTFTVPLSEKK